MWLGVGSWDTAATAIGHTDLPGGGRFVFEADQRPHTKWMYDIGANFEFSKKFQLGRRRLRLRGRIPAGARPDLEVRLTQIPHSRAH
jgi:hypothetical protein